MPEAVPATSLCLQNNPLLGIITPILFILLLLFFKGYLAHRFQCMALHHAVSCLLFFFLIYFYLKQHKLILFIYFWLRWVFVLLCEGFLQLRRAGATLHRGAWASHCRGLSRCGARAPDAQAQ